MTGAAYAWRLAAILGAGLASRLFLMTAVPTQPVSDFRGYFHAARNLVETGRYEVTPGIPYAAHPPAYPILLSFALRVAPNGEDLQAAKAANLVLALLAALAGAMLARGLWGDAAGLWTAAWITLLPRSLLMGNLIASENLFSPLLLLFLLLCTRSWTMGPSLGRAAAIGLGVGLLCLTRSVAYLMPLVWLAGAVLARRSRRALFAELVLILAVEHAVLLPWAVRNARSLGRFTFLNTVGGASLFIGNNPRATGEWYPWGEDLERLRPGIAARGALAVNDAAGEEAGRWIRVHPGRAVGLYLRKLGIILKDDTFAAEFAIFAEGVSPPPASVLRGPHPLKAHAAAVRRLLRASGVLLALCALAGWALLLRGAREGSVADRALAAGFCAAALYIPVFSAAMAVTGRYRWPVEDAIAPLAGLFLAWIPWARRRRPSVGSTERRDVPGGRLAADRNGRLSRAGEGDTFPRHRRLHRLIPVSN